MAEEEKKSGWRWGFNRWLVLGILIASFFTARAYPPMSPHIQLPAEVVSKEALFTLFGQPIYLTNTLIAIAIADIIVLAIGFAIWRGSRKSEGQSLKGIPGAVEGLLEALYSLTEGTAGKWTKTIFPFFATITFLVLVVNWMELFPGVESIGVYHPEVLHHPEECTFEQISVLGMEFNALTEFHGEESCTHAITPFVRVTSTDLNFTLALAIFAVGGIQWIGLRALGPEYLTKFFNVRTLFNKPMFGVIDFGVGLIELVSEFIKVFSFAFRLFGNIFAGSVMLFVIGSLVPIFAQSGFLLLEFFVGLVQAIVFGMLTMIFMSQATISHHGDDH